MTTHTWKQRLSALILALALTFDVAAQGLVCFADTAETIPETTAATEAAIPETMVPETTAPVEAVNEEPTVPEMTIPETTVPEETIPETTIPETTVPEETVPETTVPETTAPEVTIPETTVPEETVPEETEAVMMAPAPAVDTLYTRMLAAQTLQAMHDIMMATPSEMYAMTAEELTDLRAHAEELYAALETPSADDEDYYVLLTETMAELLGELEMEEPEVLADGELTYTAPAVITFDLAQQSVVLLDGSFEGYVVSVGETIVNAYATGVHDERNTYVITQSDSNPETPELEPTTNSINVGKRKHHCTSHRGKESADVFVEKDFTIILDGVNVTIPQFESEYNGWCAFSVTNKKASTVAVILKDGSHNVLQSGTCRAGLEKTLGYIGPLVITCEKGYEKWKKDDTQGHRNANNFSGCDETCGYLCATGSGSQNAGVHSGAGIGTGGHTNADSSLSNMTIAGGRIDAYGGKGGPESSGGAAGIGFGAAQDSKNAGRVENLRITGGTINAYRGSCSAANIGGGYRSRYVEVIIYGGTINATGMTDHYVTADYWLERRRAAAIGGGGGGYQTASDFGATVTIWGGNIEAFGQYGAAIGAGAGGASGGGSEAIVNIHGGTINAWTDAGDGGGAGAAIGSGGSLAVGKGGKATINITGGIITANSTFGAAIGGGGTQSTDTEAAGGEGEVIISNGTITINEGAIGGGRAKAGKGGEATVTITGGTVNGYAIGGGDSESGIGGAATVNISGDANLTLSGIIGGGNSSSGNGGAATVTITGGTVNGYAIGGGDSVSGNGGNATVNISGNAHLILSDIIGGGNSTSGNGGNAAVTVSGGYMKSLAIGGGNTQSQTALGGSVVSEDGSEGIKFSGGTVQTGQIGGGSNGAGDVGYASALVTGGDIRGQFVMKASEQGSCTFTMTGGKIHDVDLYDSAYTHNVKLGGAVYMDDPNGVVSISGGTIDKCMADNGGAVYMTAGQFNLSGDAVISNSEAAENGGAVYLGVSGQNKGTFAMSGGTISGNKAVNGNGGGIYLDGGDATVSGGTIGAGNIAKNGGGAYLNGGLLTLSGTGSFIGNTATDDGGGFYVNGGNFNMTNGTIHSNTATDNGGGGVVQGGNFTMEDGTIGGRLVDGETVTLLSNSATNGGGVYVSGGNFRMNNGSVVGNIAGANGGGINIADGNVTIVYGAVDYNEAANGGGMMVTAMTQSVNVTMLSGSLSNNKASVNGGGMAVDGGSADKQIDVAIGCLMDHFTGEKRALAYGFDYGTYENSKYSGHNHNACPVVSGNSCTNIGGGFYLASPSSTLNFLCVIESNNTAANSNTNCWGMDVQGGEVNIGDSVYHNCNNHTSGANNRGYIQMGSTILVEGGDVNIYGDMDNPFFQNAITVDIQLGTNGSPLGSYTDHRRDGSTTPSYKVHYVENFPESENVRTGVYIAKQYSFAESKAVQIDGALFSRPGFSIVGWYIDVGGELAEYKVGAKYDLTYAYQDDQTVTPGSLPPPQFQDTNGTWQNSVGITDVDCSDHSSYCDKDAYLLKLYAKWERTGYTFSFLPGVSDGAYSGTMEDQDFDYNTAQELRDNAYVYPGYNFLHWEWVEGNMTFVNKQVIYQFPAPNKAKIELVARWTVCDHVENETNKWSYTVQEVQNEDDPPRVQECIITGICYCGYKETLKITAQDGIYNGEPHLATLTANTQGYCPGWFENGTYKAPNISYTVVGCVLNNTVDPQLVENKPVNAGKYTATVTVGSETAVVEYTINKATQATPTEKPNYSVNQNTVTVTGIGKTGVEDTPITSSVGTKVSAPAEYRLIYYDVTDMKWEPGNAGWADNAQWPRIEGNANTIELTMAQDWTNYRIEVRFAETYNYEASKPLQADSTYFFSGNVSVIIQKDPHIEALMTFTEVTGGLPDVLTANINMSVENGYFLVNNQFVVKTVVSTEYPDGYTGTQINENPYTLEETQYPPDDKGSATYQIDKSFKTAEGAKSTTITITIGTTQPKASMTVVAKERKLYSDVVDMDAEVAIAKDSAFTAYFQVDSFDTKVTKDGNSVPVYDSDPVWYFQKSSTGATLPVNTTILLMDMSDTTKTYWHYKVDTDGISQISLKDFKQMGVENSNHPGAYVNEEQVSATLKYQFIVDFSQSEGAPEPFTMKMEVKRKSEFGTNYDYIPEPGGTVTVTTATPQFTLKKTDTADSLTKQLTLAYNSTNPASKWENRGSALRLVTRDTLPEDAYFQASVGNASINSFPISATETETVFLIPLDTLDNKNVSLTLVSEKFPPAGKTYTFDIEWSISNSLASKAPLNGDTKVDKITGLQFVKYKDTGVSLEIIGNQRIVSTNEPLHVQIESIGLDDNLYKVEAILEVKNASGSYESFGATLSMPEKNKGPMTVVAHQTGAGNYRIKIRVTYQAAAGILLDDIFYYFIAEAPQTVAPTT